MTFSPASDLSTKNLVWVAYRDGIAVTVRGEILPLTAVQISGFYVRKYGSNS